MRGSAVKVTRNIWQVGGDGLSGVGDAAIYLVAEGSSAALIDAGCGNGCERVIDNITVCIGADSAVETLFLTHCHFDHTGGAEALRRLTGCRIVAHEMDARFLEAGDERVTAAAWYGAAATPLAVDHSVRGAGETFPLGPGSIEALHAPGHSPGSMVLITRSEGLKVLFGQDVHGPLHPDLLSNRDDYLSSLTMLINLEADILCEGHFGIIKGKDKVKKFIESFAR